MYEAWDELKTPMAQNDLPSTVQVEEDGENPDNKFPAEPMQLDWPSTWPAEMWLLSCEDQHEESPVVGDDPRVAYKTSSFNLHKLHRSSNGLKKVAIKSG